MIYLGILLPVAIAVYVGWALSAHRERSLPAQARSHPAVQLVFPTLFRRYMATLLDGLLAFGLFIMVGLLPGEGETVGRTKFLAFLFLAFWYDPVFTSHWCTFGQWVTGVRVRRNDEPEERIPLWAAILRLFVKGVLGWISFFSMPFTERYRGLHDMAARSVVLQVRLPAVKAAA
jgi:hypothetical protein